MTRFSWNYTTFLNIAFLVVAAAVYWLYRNRERFGAGGGYAKDPVSGMQVERAHPGAVSTLGPVPVYFCSDRCKDKYEKDPGRYDGSTAHEEEHDVEGDTDPVCGMTVTSPDAPSAIHAGERFVFCGPGCRDRFVADPASYLRERPAEPV